MTVIFMDSFDHYASLTQKWTAGDADFGPSAGNGRFGAGMNVGFSNSGTKTCSLTIPAASTYIFGFAFRLASATALWDQPWFQFREGSTIHIDFRLDSSRRPYLTRNGTTLASSSSPLTVGVWYYLEVKVVVHDSAGSVELRVNGVNVASASSVDTRNGGTGVIDTFGMVFGNSGAFQGMSFDDFYILNTAGSVNNDFLGDVRVEALFPNGNGNASQLDGSDGNTTDNYLLVDEASPSTADYVESSDVGDKDTYAYGNLTSVAGGVAAVQILPYAAKTDAGTRSIVSVARLSGTEVDSADKPLSVSYQYLPDVREAKPGGGAWDIAAVNGAEFGVKVSA